MKPIPPSLLKDTATVKVCTGVDGYQNQTYTEYTAERVHIQPTNEIRKTQDNTECTLRSILFVDAQLSRPSLDWAALLRGAHEVQGDMRVVCDGDEYTVVGCDKLKYKNNELHHWEIALI